MKRWMKCLFAAAAVILAGLNWIIAAGGVSADRKADDEAFYKQFDQRASSLMDKYGVPGVAAALIKNGKTVYVKGYGYADLDEKTPVDKDTLFQVASNSKTITAFAIMKLAGDGKLDLDAPVAEYLTRWKLPVTRYDNNKVTLRRILSHTAGLNQSSFAGYDPGARIPTALESLSGEAKGLKELKLVTEPGIRYKYSGGGYTLAQLVIEEVTGKPFAVYMQEQILNPLGMTRSSFGEDPANNSNVSSAYGVLNQKLPRYAFAELAAAGLYTSATDLARFLSGCISIYDGNLGGHSLISPYSLKGMLTPVDEDYGLGFIVKTLGDGTVLAYHGGANRGWRSQFAFMPEKGSGIVILTNSENGKNLYDDLVSFWVNRETGFFPKYQFVNTLQRCLTGTAACASLIFLLVGIATLLSAIVKKEKVFLGRRAGKRSVSPFGARAAIRFFLPLVSGGLWLFVFYTGSLYNGWTFASFMPYGFGLVTVSALFWGLFMAARGLFISNDSKPDVKPIQAKRLGSGTLSGQEPGNGTY